MKRFILALAILALALLPAGSAIAGKTKTICFDSLPLGPLGPGPHVIGKFAIQRIDHQDNLVVVDLGDGHRGLVDSLPDNGKPGGMSIFPLAPRTSMKVHSFTAKTDGAAAILMGQWTAPWEYFESEGEVPETFVPTFAGVDLAFINLAIYGEGESHVIVSIDAEISKAVDPGYIQWETAGKSRMKVGGLGKINWTSSGTFGTEGTGYLFSAEEEDDAEELLAYGGALVRQSNRAFLLSIDGEAKAAFEEHCARRYAERTRELVTCTVTGATGRACYNPSRTKLRLKYEIHGILTGPSGTKTFTLKVRSKGTLGD